LITVLDQNYSLKKSKVENRFPVRGTMFISLVPPALYPAFTELTFCWVRVEPRNAL